MTKFNDPIERFLKDLASQPQDSRGKAKEDWRKIVTSKTLPYTVAFVVLAVSAFGAFALLIRP